MKVALLDYQEDYEEPLAHMDLWVRPPICGVQQSIAL